MSDAVDAKCNLIRDNITLWIEAFTLRTCVQRRDVGAFAVGISCIEVELFNLSPTVADIRFYSSTTR